MAQSTSPATPDPSTNLLLQFLAWVAARPRGYAETMAAWRTYCPRLQVWEDATAERLSINRGRHKPTARYWGQATNLAATLSVIIPQIRKIYRL
jgi:hypothetical protein